MKFKETRENLNPDTNDKDSKNKKPKKSKKPKKGKFEFKATIIHDKDYVSEKMRKAKEKVKELRNEAFAATKILWKPYALLIADYFNWEYYRNLKYIGDKLKAFNSKKRLTKKDLAQLEVLISINELKYYINDKDSPKTIDINLDLINRDFFLSSHEQEFYDELVTESDKKYHYSISYLIKLYNLLITFVKERKMREVFYDTVVSKEHKEQEKEHHPVVINEKIIAILPVHYYLSNKYQKKAEYINEY